eukprot:6213363-Pleurochrysis_carterae.AAC.4
MARGHGSARNHSKGSTRTGALDDRHFEVNGLCILPGRCKAKSAVASSARLCSYCWRASGG